MARGLTSQLQTLLATNNVKPGHLVSIGFSVPVFLTDVAYDITSEISGTEQTYVSSSFKMGFSDHVEETDVTKSSLTFGISGVGQDFTSIVMNENVVAVPVEIYRGFLNDPITTNVMRERNTFLLYKGKIENYVIEETETESGINFSIVSHWADFERKAGRKTNNNSQNRFFPNDLGMDFSSQTVQDIKWGRE